jgi:transcriptional regulator CtsR
MAWKAHWLDLGGGGAVLLIIALDGRKQLWLEEIRKKTVNLKIAVKHASSILKRLFDTTLSSRTLTVVIAS